jgi:hypothetical protein
VLLFAPVLSGPDTSPCTPTRREQSAGALARSGCAAARYGHVGIRPKYFLYERYNEEGPQSRLLAGYYTLKALIRRRVQFALRSA